MKRISKRFGTRPGIRIVRFKKLVVVIDTSGSLDESSLAQFFKEIDTIHKNGADVMVIECDAKVHNFTNMIVPPPLKYWAEVVPIMILLLSLSIKTEE
jgi:predicted metal-dependent peptidase